MAVIDNEKRVYKIPEIQEVLGMGRSKTYAFVKEVYDKKGPFRVIKIGESYRIPCHSFDQWLFGDEERVRD